MPFPHSVAFPWGRGARVTRWMRWLSCLLHLGITRSDSEVSSLLKCRALFTPTYAGSCMIWLCLVYSSLQCGKVNSSVREGSKKWAEQICKSICSLKTKKWVYYFRDMACIFQWTIPSPWLRPTLWKWIPFLHKEVHYPLQKVMFKIVK